MGEVTSNTNNVLRFKKKNRLSVLLEPKYPVMYTWFHVYPLDELKWYTCILIYSLYIHGGVGAINLDFHR